MTNVVVTVLTSGGLDSAACLSYYQKGGCTVRSMWIDYGQPAALAEEQAVEQIAGFYQLPLQKVRMAGINWPKLDKELFEFRGRNLTLVSLALNTATLEPGLIALGIHQGTPFADCSIAFSEQLNDLLILLSNGLLRLDCPFLTWSKQDIFDYALSNAVPVELAYSCEKGSIPPCKECVKCRDIQAIFERIVAQIFSLRQRSAPSEMNLYNFPLFVYSYSSRGFPDLPERYSATKDLAQTQLISLYDVYYSLRDLDVSGSLQTQPKLRFLDSGRYEVEVLGTGWQTEQQLQGLQPWSEELYVESAKNTALEGDVLVSYDDRSLNPTDQIKKSLSLFASIGVRDIKRDLLLHPNGMAPHTLAEVIADLAPGIDMIGLTEKDISYPWFIGTSYIRQLRVELDTLLDRYVPIHIFGCFDPQTIPYFFFSGADIFDGLAWMRYYFREGHAFYDKEFEYDTAPEKLLHAGGAIRSLLAHNIEELERLRADIQYAMLTRDLSQFERCLESLKTLGLTASSQSTTSRRSAKLHAGEKYGR